jgi:hypothetical protein
MAHLYVWAAISDILDGSASPDRNDATAARVVQRVLKISHNEQQRLLLKYDKLTAKPGAEGVK